MLATLLLMMMPQPALLPQDIEFKKKKEKKVCRSVVVTGSRLRETVCMTPTEWDAETRDSQRLMDRLKSTEHARVFVRGAG